MTKNTGYDKIKKILRRVVVVHYNLQTLGSRQTERKTVFMKIGISDGRKWGDEYYWKLKSFGFDCYDFNMMNTNVEPYIYDEKDFYEYLSNEKRLADEAGITVWQVHGPWRYPPLDSTLEYRAERLEKMKRSIRGAAILGAKYWVVHPIMPFGTKDILTNNEAETRELNLEFMNKLLPIAKQEGITVCLENMPMLDFSLSSPTAIVELIKEINDPSFAMCLDTGHANICIDWHTPAEAIREYAKFIKVLHVHDNHGKRDEHLAPFHGTIDWKDFSAALHETAFDGVLSLECAPSGRLPNDILEDMYSIYYKIAKAVYECREYSANDL